MAADIWKDRDVAKAFLNERSLVIPDRQRQFEVLLRVVRFHCPQPRRLLDVGCGDGLLLGLLLEAFPHASGVAVDFSPHMLEQARQGLGQRTIVAADLQTPTWKNSLTGPFDVIVSGFAIHHLTHERKRALYREIYDLLAAGGVFVNSEHVASATLRNEQLCDAAMSEHLFQRRREKGENVTLEQVTQEFLTRPDRAANLLAPVEEQCRWLQHIGFRDVDCYWKLFELAIFGGIK